MNQLAKQSSSNDLSQMKKQYSELLKMTKEIENLKTKSAKRLLMVLVMILLKRKEYIPC